MGRLWVAVVSVFAAALFMAPEAGALTFSPTDGSPFAVSVNPQMTAVGDFNGDQKLDIAVVNNNGNNVSVLLGDGSGGFSPAIGSPFSADGMRSTAVAVGDFNGDHKLDLAVANYNSDDVAVLLGDGSGAFSPSTGSPVAVGGSPASVAVGDFNGDNKLDFATANALSNTVSVLLGDGSGGFSPAIGSPFAVGNIASAVSVGDFNGDHKFDLAIANFGGNSVSILLGDGSGGFSPATGSPFAVGAAPYSVALGDFNGDKQLDLATANSQSNNVSVLLGDGSGGFSPATGSPFAVSGNPLSVAPGDFNADGKLDLAANTGSTASVLLGDGSGGFSPAAGSPFGVGGSGPSGTLPSSFAVGDFNGDGRPDLAIPNYSTNNVSVLLDAPPDTSIQSGPSSATRQTEATFVFSSPDSSSSFQCRLDGGAWTSCHSPKSYSGLAAGSHTFDVRATNEARLTDPTPATDSWTVDLSTPPVATLDVSPNPVLTGNEVMFDASQSHDALDGTIVDYQWDLGSGSFALDTGSTPTTAAAYDAAGVVHARVKVTNEVGDSAIAAVAVDVRPAPPPGDVGISINNGDYATNSQEVQLHVVWPAFASEARISNDGGFGPAGGTQTVSVAATIPWTLFSAGSERLPKIVYLRFPDSTNPTQTFTDDIILDTTSPVVKGATSVTSTAADIATASARVRRHVFRVRIHAAEHLSGISAAQFATRRARHSKRTTVIFTNRRHRGILKLHRVVRVKMRKHPRWVRVRSAAGNWSKWHRIR